jgi:uncharacterized membrane protein YsdA (DUF1294 family)
MYCFNIHVTTSLVNRLWQQRGIGRGCASKARALEGLLWLDKTIAMQRRKTPKKLAGKRIPESLLLQYCEESGLIGLELMMKYNHKIGRPDFVKSVVNDLDNQARIARPMKDLYTVVELDVAAEATIDD